MTAFPQADEGDQLYRIVDLGGLFFVVGNHGTNGGIWHSADGVAWRLASEVPASHTELGAFVRGIARTDVGYVAVGANHVVDGAFPLIWFSPDGDHWTDVTPDANECIPFDAVTASEDRFVAVGAVCRYDEQAGPQQDGVSFESSDGVHWDRSPSSSELVDFALGEVVFTDSAFVAVGAHLGGSAGTLQSTNGLTWIRSPDPGVPAAGYFRRLVWATGQYIAIGQFRDTQDNGYATTWSSHDLIKWEQHLLGGAQTQAIALALDGEEWVVIGGVIRSDYASSSFIEWRSADGADWSQPSQILSGPSGYVSDVVATPGGLVAIGGVLTETPVTRSSLPMLFTYVR